MTLPKEHWNRSAAWTNWESRVDFPLYIAIKEQMCRCALEAQKGRNSGLPSRFTARRIFHLVAGPLAETGDSARLLTDMHSASPHLVRDRLKSLNSGMVLQREGHGLRNAAAYRWVEPIREGTLESFRQVRTLVGANIAHALDVYRLSEVYGLGPFRTRDFARLMHEHWARFGRRSWNNPPPVRFTKFLVRRLQSLIAEGLVDLLPDQRLQLSARGANAAHWFEMFTYPADVDGKTWSG